MVKNINENSDIKTGNREQHQNYCLRMDRYDLLGGLN